MILFFQRYFQPLMWLLLALLGLGLGHLAAASLGLWLSGAPAIDPATPETAATASAGRSLGDYEVILQHNVFDPSARGSGTLSATSKPVRQEASEPAPETAAAPKNIDLLGTVAGGNDPLAMLQVDREVEIVHVGDQLPGGITVEYIERLLVHLRHADGSVSKLSLQEDAPAPAGGEVASARRDPGTEKFEVRSLGENRWVIPRSEAERARSNLGELLKSAHLVPNVVNGSTEGFMVRMIRPDSLLAQLGLRVGDVVKEVNGVELSSPEKALQIFTQLRDARNISLGLVRNGKQLSFDYAVD